MHVREVNEAAERIAAIAKLQADELQLILDELAGLAADVEAEAAPATSAETGPSATVTDPAAASPKRAKWLAEQERRSHMSRRELLRGRGAADEENAT